MFSSNEASIEEYIQTFKDLEIPGVEHYTDAMVTLLSKMQRMEIDVEAAYQRFQGIHSVFGVQYNSVGERTKIGKQLHKMVDALYEVHQFLSHHRDAESESVQ